MKFEITDAAGARGETEFLFVIPYCAQSEGRVLNFKQIRGAPLPLAPVRQPFPNAENTRSQMDKGSPVFLR
jgi:hypothetical protein